MANHLVPKQGTALLLFKQSQSGKDISRKNGMAGGFRTALEYLKHTLVLIHLEWLTRLVV